MRFRAPIALAAAAALALTACSSEPAEAEEAAVSLNHLTEIVEGLGYGCLSPADHPKYTQVNCGPFELSIDWYKTAAAEARGYDEMLPRYSNLPAKAYLIRSENWRIRGDESAVRKVAEALEMKTTFYGESPTS